MLEKVKCWNKNHTFLFYVEVDKMQEQVNNLIVSSGLAHNSILRTESGIPLFIRSIDGIYENNEDKINASYEDAYRKTIKQLRSGVEQTVKIAAINNDSDVNIKEIKIYQMITD